MKIRYQLFLVVGTLFFLCYFIAVGVQAYVTKDSIRKAQSEVVAQIDEMHREKRIHIEDFLTSIIAQKFGQIQTLLMAISSYPPQAENLFNGEMGWENLGEVLYSNKWLDFLEQSREGFADASLFIDKRALKEAKIVAQAQNNPSILKVEADGKEWIAIVVPFELLSTVSKAVNEEKEMITPFLLFTQDQINTLASAHLSKEKAREWTPVVEKLESLIAEAANLPSWEAMTLPSTPVAHPDKEVQKFDEHLKIWIKRSDQVVMTRILSEMAALQLFGKTPTDATFPHGIAVFPRQDSRQSPSGNSIMTAKALLQGIEVEKAAIPALSKEFPFPSYVFTVGNESIFIGSALEMQAQDKTAELLLGVCLRDIAQELSSEFDMPFFCVLNGKIFLQGTKWDHLLETFPLERTDSQNNGIVNIDHESVFFMRMKPIPGTDLEFFAVNYAAREFAFLDYFERGAKQVLHEISKQMWIVAILAMIAALFIFNRLAKRITEPVSKLAAAADAVSKGRLIEVALPKIRINRNDEIHTLYSSFDDMVRSLKEKEKVRGALNKVVSPIIASEILKSEMQLGGEKKKVCIWFADIRGFTNMTESMKPEEVIVMLNHCMTRVSHVIDENKGIIDKYVGDEVMALFGIPNRKEDDALRAVQAAIEVQKLLEDWNRERQAEGKPPVQMGIGMDIGDVLAGNMGAIDRQNYTVLGRHVNIASRLCSKASPGQVLVTEAIASSSGVRDRYLVREVGKESLKGFTEPIVVYEVQRK